MYSVAGEEPGAKTKESRAKNKEIGNNRPLVIICAPTINSGYLRVLREIKGKNGNDGYCPIKNQRKKQIICAPSINSGYLRVLREIKGKNGNDGYFPIKNQRKKQIICASLRVLREIKGKDPVIAHHRRPSGK